MFDKLFTHPAVLRRHREGPFAVERTAYLRELDDQGMVRGTLLRRAAYCLCVAIELQRLGVATTARASFAFYNTREEVDALVSALHHVNEVFA